MRDSSEISRAVRSMRVAFTNWRFERMVEKKASKLSSLFITSFFKDFLLPPGSGRHLV